MTIMKKILLIATAALVTLSASAINRGNAPKAKVASEKKAVLATPGAFKNFAVKQNAENSFFSGIQHKASKVAQVQSSRRAEETIELTPCYSEWTYFYSTIMGGFIPKIMHDQASFAIEGDKAYLAPFKNLGEVEGVLNTEAENPYAEYGAVVYTFTSDVIAKYTDPNTQEQTDLTLEPCIVENYTPYRSSEKTFDAYYIAEYNELYIPSDVTLALFDDKSNEVFDEFYVARHLDLVPQETLNEYISKGTFSNKSYYGEKEITSGECQIYLGSSNAIYVKGADASGATNAWIEYDFDETDKTLLSVFDNEYVGTFNFYDDESRTTTHPGVVATVGLLQADGELTGFNAAQDYASFYKWTDNADETSTITNTDGTVYGDYVYEDEAYGNGGMYNAVDQTITISYEPAFDAIKNVNVETGKFNGVSFNLAGQKVNANQKGLIIRDGKKFIVR